MLPEIPDITAAAVQKQPNLPFPVVGIGASAGGLAALLRLFQNMPATNGMAYVVVLHLSPKNSSNADQVLQRVTGMPVEQVTAPASIEPDHVYVIAPNMELSMDEGKLTVAPLAQRHGQHNAIDNFFRALAEAQQERAVAVVLSGTGGDGAVGIARVKEKGGVILVQSPSDAEHDGMPLSAIGTGMVDFVLPVAEMPKKLIELWENARTMEIPPSGPGEPQAAQVVEPHGGAAAEEALQRIVGLLRVHTGHDFRHYKRATVLRRIERRMQVRGMHSLPEYLRLIETDASEHKLLLGDLLIGVTNFFRDRAAFEALERDVLPVIFNERRANDQVRAWVAACATGEEAYSVAMLLADQAAAQPHAPAFQVFASDIDEHAIAVARAGLYPTSIVTDLPPVRLREFFTREDGRYRIRKALRDRILFASHNLLRDPPFSHLDLITCRNLLIYLNRDVQLRLLETFHFALKPGGFLFLGISETAEAADELFVAVDKKNRIYRARAVVRPLPQHAGAPGFASDRRHGAQAQPRREIPATEIHQRALARFAAPSAVVDSEHNVVHMSDSFAQYLRFVGGEPSRNVLSLVLPELRTDLRSALYQAQRSNQPAIGREARITRDGKLSSVELQVHPFRDDEAGADYALVVFTETGLPDGAQAAGERPAGERVIAELEAELQRKKEQLQQTVEEAEISTQQLRAANEELQAINEELRSASEELETSKEELQSMNAELVTVNYELKLRVDETAKANDDLNNLIAATDIATVFVDSALRIKRFTPRAADIFSIIPGDIGRSLLDLTHRLEYARLADDVANAFNTLRLVEREVRSIDGHHYIARVQPYRTTDDRIEGAVLTFFDITRSREAEAKLQAGEASMRLVAASTRDYAIVTIDKEGRATSWNQGAERMFGYSEQEVLGRELDFLYLPEDRERGALADELRRAREEGRAEAARWQLRKDGSRFFAAGVTSPLHNEEFDGYVKIARDETERVREEQEREHELSSEHLGRSNAETASALKDEFLAIMAHELRHPLNLIHINVELLSRLPELRQLAPAARAAGVIRNAVLSQAKIIDDLLDMSRVRTGKLTLSMAPLDLAQVAQASIEAMRADPGATALSIELQGAEVSLKVLADPVRMEQVLMNLLSNAVKFTPAGGKVVMSLSREQDEARVDVIDSGQGIAPTFLPNVFDMFGQPGSVTTRAKGGLGIGLALVREIVTLHGGRVEAASEGIGKGARFSFWLPLLAESAELEPAGTEPAHNIAGVRVLLVDDVEDAAMVCKALLEMHGAVVSVATSAREALGLLEQQDCDILVSDISMPQMDGYELLREMRKMPRHAKVPAIAVTGLAREQDIAAARAAGFAAHIGKPMSVERLAEIIADLLPEHRSAA